MYFKNQHCLGGGGDEYFAQYKNVQSIPGLLVSIVAFQRQEHVTSRQDRCNIAKVLQNDYLFSSIPCHSYEKFASDTKVLQMIVRGSRMNVLPQFAGPVIYRLRSLPRSMASNLQITSANMVRLIPLLCMSFFAYYIHSP